MIAVALLVLLFALLLTIAVITGGGDSLTVDMFGSEVSTSGAALFLTGLVTGAGALLALWLLRIGLKKGWRERKSIQDLRRRAEMAGEADREPTPSTPSTPPTEATTNEKT